MNEGQEKLLITVLSRALSRVISRYKGLQLTRENQRALNSNLYKEADQIFKRFKVEEGKWFLGFVDEELRVDLPRYQHDCVHCKYLGRVLRKHVEYDLWIRSAGMIGGTVIARYGDTGSEYKSLPLSIAYYDPELAEAANRSKNL